MSFNGPMSDISDNSHSLLEPQSPAYSNVTVRRAFIVWMYCGQRNKFKDVCNYYHHLEALEDQLPPENRALSRHHEFNLFSSQPPTSTYLIRHFPQLYKETYIERYYLTQVEEIKNENSVFKQEGFNEIAPKQGTTTQEIVEASHMIRKYCRLQMVSLKKFLEEFKQHAKKCDLKCTVNNVVFYIKRKMVQAEIELEANYPKTLSFLNSSSTENNFNDTQNNAINDDCILENWKAASSCETDFFCKPIKILRKGAEIDNVANNYHTCNIEKSQLHIRNDINMNNVILKDNISDSKMIEPLPVTTDDIKSVSLEDLTDKDDPIKKERRFSGSRFMKLEIEKFRKI